MNQDYAKQKEDEGFKLLKEFNEKVLKLKDLGRTPEKHTTDASGFTSDNKYINIELKKRNMRLTDDFKLSAETYTVDTLFIEAHKAGDLLLDYICYKHIPLYINFLDDDTVIVFNLSTLKHRPRKIAKKIESKLYEAFELGKREGLLLKDAYIYKKINNSYKLIHKQC